MIRAIELNSRTSYVDENGRSLFALYDLNKVNIFIGENNSGKSRLMRTMLVNKSCKLIGDEPSNENSVRWMTNTIRDIEQIVSFVKNLSEVEPLELDCQALFKIQSEHRYYEIYKCVSHTINAWLGDATKTGKPISRRLENLMGQLRDCLHRCSEYVAKNTGASVDGYYVGKVYDGRCFYIPLLRGIENFDSYFDKTVLNLIDEASLTRKQWQAVDAYAKNSGHIYEEKVSKAYGIDKKCVFTAENLYEEVREKLLGMESQREQVREFQDFISNNFYNGEGFTLIPRKVKNGSEVRREYLAVKIGKSEERPLYDLGDGIKQMITILYKIFEKKDEEAIFLIEEPEINLHPGFQKKLMRILQSDIFKKHQYFIVTHSNHILESFIESDDVSIYKVMNVSKRNDLFKVVRTTSNDLEILDLLGVSNMSVMLANSLIFVEGLSDKILIQKYLEIFFAEHGRNYQEGVHYAFVETGGGNIAHWDFLDDLESKEIDKIHASDFSNRSFVICDNDGGTKKERKERLKTMVGDDNFLELPVREIENTVKRSVLERALFGDANISVKKEYNENSHSSGYYNQKRIGKFIDGHYDLPIKYAAKSGTVKEKIQFAKNIVRNINTYEDLTEHAVELCKRITAFIGDANPS